IVLKPSLPVQTGQVTSPLVHHPMRQIAVRCNADVVTEDRSAGRSINCAAEEAAALDRSSAVGTEYVALSANPRSIESAVKAYSDLEGNNRVCTGCSLTNDVFTVSSASACRYRLGLSFRQRQ